MKIFIETERLILRELVPSDDAGLFELDSDPDVHKYLGSTPFETIEQSRQIIAFVRQQYLDNGIGRWAVIEKSSNNFIGWTGLKLITTPMNNQVNFYDLGYRLIRKYWGQGYATESAKASLHYAFNKMNLEAVYAMADVNNIASINVLKKTGLQLTETITFEGRPTHWFKAMKEQA